MYTGPKKVHRRYKCMKCGKKRSKKYLYNLGRTLDVGGCNRYVQQYKCINTHRCETGQSYHIPEKEETEEKPFLENWNEVWKNGTTQEIDDFLTRESASEAGMVVDEYIESLLKKKKKSKPTDNNPTKSWVDHLLDS